MNTMKKIGILFSALVCTFIISGCGDFISRTVEVKSITIKTQSDLMQFRDMVNNSEDGLEGFYITLESDIDLSDVEWEPIKSFNGTFDGKYYTIEKITINAGNKSGFFAYLEKDGIIRNLTIKNIVITGIDEVGGLAGGNLGTIENSHISGIVTGSNAVGGLVGGNLGTIRNSSAFATVSGNDYVGGFVGLNMFRIEYCQSSGTVNGIGKNVGEFVGLNDEESGVVIE